VKEAATVLAALIGATVGSLGAVWLTVRARRADEARARRLAVVKRYLFQLQDAADTLWFRVDNLRNRGGRWVMSDDYFAESTLYALGRVLAVERVFALEGVYPELADLDAELGAFVKEHRVDPVLAGTTFYQYHRLTLAETLLERQDDRYQVSTYAEFRRRYADKASGVHAMLEAPREGLQALDGQAGDDLMNVLADLARGLSRETRLASTIPDKTG
jgi:hypothetical protein